MRHYLLALRRLNAADAANANVVDDAAGATAAAAAVPVRTAAAVAAPHPSALPPISLPPVCSMRVADLKAELSGVHALVLESNQRLVELLSAAGGAPAAAGTVKRTVVSKLAARKLRPQKV